MWRSIQLNSCTIRSIFMASLLLGILNECKGPKQRCSNKKAVLKFEILLILRRTTLSQILSCVFNLYSSLENIDKILFNVFD